MKASGKKKPQRNFSDIHPDMHSSRSGIGKRVRRYFGDHTINLRPTFYKRHRWLVSGAAVAAAVASVFLVRQMLTRAEVADFYPSTCLGTWQNPANAQGKPETFGDASSSFTGANSAIFAPSSEGSKNQIFCGGFLPPDFQPQGTLTSVGLTLVWQIGTASTSDATSAISSSSIPDVSTSTEQSSLPSTSSTSSSSRQATSTEKNSSSSASLLFGIFSRFFTFARFAGVSARRALADETSSTANASSTAAGVQISSTASVSVVSSSSPATASASSSPPTSASSGSSTGTLTSSASTSASSSPEAAAATTAGNSVSTSTLPDKNNQTSTQNSSATPPGASSTATSTPIIVPPPPDDNFLAVSYSTDGQNWDEIARINSGNWRNFSVILPIASWDLLKKIQIQVEEIPTTANPAPKVYLDGMLLEAKYDIAPSLMNSFLASSTTPGNPDAAPGKSPAPPPELEKVPNPFPGMPQVVLPSSTSNVDTTSSENGAPVIRVDVNSLQ